MFGWFYEQTGEHWLPGASLCRPFFQTSNMSSFDSFAKCFPLIFQIECACFPPSVHFSQMLIGSVIPEPSCCSLYVWGVQTLSPFAPICVLPSRMHSFLLNFRTTDHFGLIFNFVKRLYFSAYPWSLISSIFAASISLNLPSCITSQKLPL